MVPCTRPSALVLPTRVAAANPGSGNWGGVVTQTTTLAKGLDWLSVHSSETDAKDQSDGHHVYRLQ